MADCGCEIEVKDRSQAKTLIILLVINGVMFLVELVAGLLGQSTALLADSLDNLADATVYAIGLYAVARTAAIKSRAAFASGIVEMMLGFGVLAEVLRRFFVGSEPESLVMVFVGLAALVANLVCMALLYKHREGEIHMRASWIFSTNDVIANLGVISAGLLVAWLGSPYPDLVIGTLVALVVIRGGVRIMREARAVQVKV